MSKEWKISVAVAPIIVGPLGLGTQNIRIDNGWIKNSCVNWDPPDHNVTGHSEKTDQSPGDFFFMFWHSVSSDSY